MKKILISIIIILFALSLSAQVNKMQFKGSTSGTVTLDAPAVAGTKTYTIGTADSDTTTLFVFGTGSGAAADTALFNDNRYAGAFYNAGSDTLHITELRGVLEDGTGTETISVQVSWDVNCFDGTPTNLNSSALAIVSLTSGTVDTSFAANDIPPGTWVWCTLSGASKDNKPTMLILNLKGYKRNRSY